jgi:hypothetical protein
MPNRPKSGTDSTRSPLVPSGVIDAAEAERRRIGVIAAKGFVHHFLRYHDAESLSPQWHEECGQLSAYRHIIRECGLTHADDPDGDMPDDIYARELLAGLPELEKERNNRRVRKIFFDPIGTTWMEESP